MIDSSSYKANSDKHPQLDDHQLIYQLISGNEQLVIDHLLKRLRPRVSYLKSSMLKGLDLNENDLLNDFYLYLHENNWAKLRSFRFESKFTTWIHQVASRYFYKKYCKSLKEKVINKTPLEGISTLVVDESTDQTRISSELLDAILNLRDKREQLVLILIIRGYDLKEIAKKIGVTPNNLYTIKFRAIEKLRKLLNE